MNPFAAELQSRLSPDPAAGGGNPFAAELAARNGSGEPQKRDFGIDWLQPVETVRAELARRNLEPEEREDALRQWADAFVANERAQGAGGPLQALGDTVRGVARGTLVGPFIDELTAKTEGLIHRATGGSFGAPEDESLAYQRARDRAADRENPGHALASKVVGGIASAKPLLEVPKSLLARIGLGAGVVGPGHGYVHGFGEAEGDVAQRHEQGMQGAGAGAVFGAAIPVAGAAVTRGGAKVAETFAPSLARLLPGGSADKAADTVLAQRMQRSGSSPLAAGVDFAEGQAATRVGSGGARAELPEMLADTTDDLRRLTGSVYRVGGEAGETVRTALEGRQRGPANPYAPLPDEQRGQMATVMDAFNKALGISTSKGAARTEAQLIESMRREADQLYDAARKASEPFDLQPALDGLALRLQQYPSPFAAKLTRALNLFTTTQPNRQGRWPVDNITRFDAAKKALDDMIERSEGNLRRELTDFKGALLYRVHEPDAAGAATKNLAYQEAREAYTTGSAQREAIDMGRRALNQESDVTIDTFRQLDAAQRKMFRIGLRESLRNRMGRMKPGDDVSRMFQERRIQEILDEALPGAARPERFGEYMRRQGRMVQTRNEVLGGSQTAQRQGDDLELAGSVLGQMVNRWRSSPSIANMAIEAMAEGWKRVFGFRHDVALSLARRLTESDPERRAAVLAAIQARMGRDRFGEFARFLDEANNRLIAIGARQPGAQPGRPADGGADAGVSEGNTRRPPGMMRLGGPPVEEPQEPDGGDLSGPAFRRMPGERAPVPGRTALLGPGELEDPEAAAYGGRTEVRDVLRAGTRAVDTVNRGIEGAARGVADTFNPASVYERERAALERRAQDTVGENLAEFGAEAAPQVALGLAPVAGRAASAALRVAPKTAATGLAAIGLGASNTSTGETQSRAAPSEATRQLQQKLKDAGYYKGPIDGVTGDVTMAAQERFEADQERKNQQEIERARAAADAAKGEAERRRAEAELAETQRKAEDDRRKAEQRVAGEERLRQVEQNVPWYSQAIRDYGPAIGYGVGAAMGIVSRAGIVRGYNAIARRTAERADALMANAGSGDWPSRAARVNQFWGEGQSSTLRSRRQVPFTAEPTRQPPFRSNADAPAAADLYQPNRAKNLGTDAGALLAFGGEAVITDKVLGERARADLIAARQAMQDDPSEANIARFQGARDLVAYTNLISNLGRGGALAYLGTSAKVRRDSQIRPNVSAAEAERSRIDAYLGRSEGPTRPAPRGSGRTTTGSPAASTREAGATTTGSGGRTKRETQSPAGSRSEASPSSPPDDVVLGTDKVGRSFAKDKATGRFTTKPQSEEDRALELYRRAARKKD